MTLDSELNQIGHFSWLHCFYSSTAEFWSVLCAPESRGCGCLLLLGAVMCSGYRHWLWGQTSLAVLIAPPLMGWAILEQLTRLPVAHHFHPENGYNGTSIYLRESFQRLNELK